MLGGIREGGGGLHVFTKSLVQAMQHGSITMIQRCLSGR